MVVKNQNIAPPYISSNFALVRQVGLLIIIPCFLESSSEVVAAGNRAAQTCLVVRIYGSSCDSTEPTVALHCPFRFLSITEEHEYTPHRNGGKNGISGQSHFPFCRRVVVERIQTYGPKLYELTHVKKNHSIIA